MKTEEKKSKCGRCDGSEEWEGVADANLCGDVVEGAMELPSPLRREIPLYL